ncbi:ABC transporter permease [Paenibacillus chitinolyticus]|uniref:ABC transporter permease n=1 Tax=Paenibacillus chitinolyticus TaxID=79263 RepID=A0A410X3N1_9BACL|nr:ABC-2 family transporter protein [Paenibacillus chitinolyticus]MCY9593158.1 ABC-2 family transporter protein [Paenibacillus chitinolyticus]MCY9595325.1 ABC-2 family transporter protein [Paenibacillus chitinolyticus]QAV21201.1 ABC transporter permease [Paenibacillus chitinolyticus]
MFYLSLILDYLKNYLKTRLTYRSDFWIEVVSDLLFNGLNLVFILVVFQQTALLGDWNRDQILFIYGFFMIPYGLFSTIFNLWNFSERYIVKGEMDRILTRPAHSLWQVMLENMDPASLFSALAGLVVMIYSWVQLDLPVHWSDPLVMLMMVVSGVLIYGGIYVSLSALAFFSDSPTGIMPLIWNIQNYGRYPVTIYNKLLRGILTWILPFAFVGFYPAAYFLDPLNWKGVALLTPVVGIVFITIGLSVWNIGVKRYRGAGS